MHILESYALNAGAKIRKPYVYEKFVPLPFEKYITTHIFSKNSKNYDYWQEVIDIIKPELDKKDIKIIQIGGAQDTKLNSVFCMCGQTSFGQSAYLIKNAMLHLGADSFPAHLSSVFTKPCVVIFNNNYVSNVCPYFGDKSKQIFIEPDRSKYLKPNFTLDESPKIINTIKPTEIAAAALKLLDIEYNYPYKYLYHGDFYTQRIIESVPDQVIDNNALGVGTLVMRYDLRSNDQMLAEQLKRTDCVILTDKLPNPSLIQAFKQRIKQIVFKIEKTTNPNDVLTCQQFGIQTDMIGFMDQKTLDSIKLDFLEVGLIHNRIPKKILDYDEIKGKPLDNLYYKTNRFILSQGKIYTSNYSYFNGISAEGFDDKIQPIKEDIELLSNDIMHFSVLEKES